MINKKLYCGLMVALVLTSFISALDASFLSANPAGDEGNLANPGAIKLDDMPLNPVDSGGKFDLKDLDKDGYVNILDVVYLINYIYKQGSAPTPVERGDIDEDGSIDYNDVIYFVNYLYGRNYSIEDIDTVGPTIELLEPEDDYTKKTSKSEYEIDFEYRASDNFAIDYCVLILDNDIEETQTSVREDGVNIISIDLERGSYDWAIKCVDVAGNENTSETRDLRIKKKTTSSSNNYNLNDNDLGDNTDDLNSGDQDPVKLNDEKKESWIENIDWKILVGIFLILIVILLILIFSVVRR